MSKLLVICATVIVCEIIYWCAQFSLEHERMLFRMYQLQIKPQEELRVHPSAEIQAQYL